MKRMLFLAVLITVAAVRVRAAPVPSFQIPDPVSTGASGYNWWRGAGDFTQDGRVDLVLTRNYPLPGIITVLPGDGTGGFGTPITTPLPTIPRPVVVGDFDKDGRLDVLGPVYSGNQVLNQIQVFLGDGNGGFTSGPTLPGAATTLACADFDRDGHLDLARNFDEGATVGVKVYRGDGSGAFVLWQTLVVPFYISIRGLTATDLDADGWPDLLYWAGYLTARLNTAGSGFGPEVTTPTSSTDLDAVADFDDDGWPDALAYVSHSYGEPSAMQVALGRGDGSFTGGPECVALLRSGRHYGAAAADFTGDRRVDVLAGDGYDETVLMSVLEGGLLRVESRYFTGGTYPLVLDLDMDGRHEIVAGGIGELAVTRCGPAGPRAPRTVATLGFGEVMASGDINNDGRRDLVMSHKLTGLLVDVLLGAASGGLLPPFTVPVVREAKALALGDLNGDGHDDLVVGSLPSDGKNLEILLGSASGQLTPWIDTHNGSANAIYDRGLGLADMNGDRWLDIVTSTFQPLSVLPNRGDGTFADAIHSGQGRGSVSSLLLEDFDGDGIEDAVAVADYLLDPDDVQSMVFVNLGNGDGTFRFEQLLWLDAGVPSAAAGYVDGDGGVDVLVVGTRGTHTGLGGLYYLRNFGGTVAIEYRDPAAPGGDVVAADFNGDGAVEVVASGVGPPSQLELRVNDGSGGLTQVLWLPTPYAPYDMLAADLVGGSQMDLAVLNSEFNPSTVVLFENETPIPTGVPDAPWSGPFALRVVPNPMRVGASLHFDLVSSESVRIRIYDVAGRLLRELGPMRFGAGRQAVSWDGRDAEGRLAPVGVLFANLVAGQRETTAKVLRLR